VGCSAPMDAVAWLCSLFVQVIKSHQLMRAVDLSVLKPWGLYSPEDLSPKRAKVMQFSHSEVVSSTVPMNAIACLCSSKLLGAPWRVLEIIDRCAHLLVRQYIRAEFVKSCTILYYENTSSIFYEDCSRIPDGSKDNKLPKHEKSSVLIMKLSAAWAKSSGPQKGDRDPPGAARAA
jgi:hypothetical protein